ncbi:hypothetical protein AFCDBAGC_3812 [Methylobacterium cerastii]|uniref:HTH cro/C1-type domain-containing protein n=1 Tax=Methylobacterium cerastii TaxID=932741 RepID=A0ABQ4QMG2_9HYPH|nr:helix-turn-helix transcriptional regulator [Methylobacterium cerastii]GJD45934.1 hypothetical protein AFCDBAGC_3812 [Methylobacterium cerastii]
MSDPTPKYAYENTKIANLIRDRINELSGVKTQRQIAAEIGYDKPQVLSMYKRGEAKVPLERLPAFARALDIDLVVLFRAGLEQWWPNEREALDQMFSERIVSARERALLEFITSGFQESDIDNAIALLEGLRRATRG